MQFDSARIESNRHVPLTNRVSSISRFKNEEGSYYHCVSWLEVRFHVLRTRKVHIIIVFHGLTSDDAV